MQTTFGAFLSARRKEKGLTQKEVANALYVSESTVGKWEQNRANPDISALPALSALLGVSEHELITASIDTEQRETVKNAKKWKRLTTGWNLFFVLSFGITLLTCFICNVAVNKALDWFWVVAASLACAGSFLLLPQYIQRHRLLVLSLSELGGLLLLLGVCRLYTGGNWFFVAALPILFAFACVFLPLFVVKYPFPRLIKKFAPTFCLLADILLLTVMFLAIEEYALREGYTEKRWTFSFALPLFSVLLAFVVGCIADERHLPIRRAYKHGILLAACAVFYPAFLLLVEFLAEKALNAYSTTVRIPNFSVWSGDYINYNVHALVIIALCLLSVGFFLFGFLRKKK